MSEIPLLANMPVQSDFPFFHDYLLFKMLKYKTPNILPNGKTTEGLVQQHLHRINFCGVLTVLCSEIRQLLVAAKRDQALFDDTQA
jgi:hypothetical protein